MRISFLQFSGIRCFDDTGRIKLSPGCNIFVGQNNSGKSTVLRGALSLQGMPFTIADIRPGSENSYVRIGLDDIQPSDRPNTRPGGGVTNFVADHVFHGEPPQAAGATVRLSGNGLFDPERPRHSIVPFVAKRKAPDNDQSVAFNAQAVVTGTYRNLVARIDTVATAGHPRHAKFVSAVNDIVGIHITTKAAANGKEAGHYLDDHSFIALERMGDGVTELAAHIVELVLEERKVFVLEEPESFLHPKALKALLGLIRDAATRNQFLIATHSNIVLRELADSPGAKIFRVARLTDEPRAASIVQPVPATVEAHREILRELGYEFADFGLHEGWLFLEEASAESVIREALIPVFAPELRGRLRTFSAAGASNLQPRVGEFVRLVSFVHLQPVYSDRIWIRADNDEAGQSAVAALTKAYAYLAPPKCDVFNQPAFEHYYPERFARKVAEVLALNDKNKRREAKSDLAKDVIRWTEANPAEATVEWSSSAPEVVTLLRDIAAALAA